MEFNTTTFILEIINFLILIWILQRLFYKPVLEIIAQRKQHIDQSLEDAKKLHREADDLRALYENRQQLWEQEKKAAQAGLHQQLETERSQQLELLNKELEQVRQKSQVTFNHQQEEWRRQAEKQAMSNGARFASLILQQCAGPEVESRLLALLIEHLNTIPESTKLSIQTADLKKSSDVKVASAFALSNALKQELEQCLVKLIKRPLSFQYQQDNTLIAGVRIDIGTWVLHVNLANELAGFAGIAYEPE